MDIHHDLQTPREGQAAPVPNIREMLQKLDDIHAAAMQAIQERDALAAQNLALREALEEIDGYAGGADSVLDDQYVTERRQAALALPLPDAAREVEQMREKAGLLDWLIKHGFHNADVSIGDDEDRKPIVYFRITFEISEPRDWPKYDDEEWRDSEVLAALRAAKAGGK